VRHAYEKTEGYRDLYRQAGVCPEDIQTLGDIRFLPFTTKELFRDNLEAFSVKSNFRVYLTTGGSTGIPFGFYESYNNIEIEDAFMHTGWSWAGWKRGSRSAILRGAFIGSENSHWKYDPYNRDLLLSSYYLTEKTLEGYLKVLKQYKPKVLQAYPSSLNLFCDLLKDAHLCGEIGFDLILLGSENVYDWQLTKFKEIFPHAKIHGWYGHAEKAVLAPWCEYEEVYHLWPFYGFTEILGEKNQEVNEGLEGELVGTSFHNLVTPFIRYRTMDRAIKGSPNCPSCGRAFPILKSISGRSHEVIVTASGRYISMTAINMHDDIFDGLRQFQFLQEQPGKVIFKYLPKKELLPSEITSIQIRLMLKLGNDMELSMVPVNEIPRTKSGKYRFLDQRLPIRYGDVE